MHCSIIKHSSISDLNQTVSSFSLNELLRPSEPSSLQALPRCSFFGVKLPPPSVFPHGLTSKCGLFFRRTLAILDVPEGQGTSSGSNGKGLPPLSIAGFDGSLETSPGYMSSEQWVFEKVVRQVADGQGENPILKDLSPGLGTMCNTELLEEAYARCGEVCAEYAKTFYLGTKLMTPDRQRAIWAIYVWCRRTDELVDGPNAARITPRALDRWEERLEDIFNGEPYDMLDAALTHTVTQFPVKLQPFRDMVEGMRMDLRKSRYENFDELYLYCYNVAGTVGLMSMPVMGIDSLSTVSREEVYGAALALGIANQLTNILRDVGEDARRGRIYLPQDELASFGLNDVDIFAGEVTDKWREFMKFQIARARDYFKEAESGVYELDKQSRWPVWASLSLYRQILDAIEANDYNNFTKRAYVGKLKKILSLPGSFLKAQIPPNGREFAFTKKFS